MTQPPTETVVPIPLAKLHIADDNVRRRTGNLAELAASIQAVGILEPIIATENPTLEGEFLIVAGARRAAAAAIAYKSEGGLARSVPVIVRKVDEKTRVESMLIENLQREDLEPLEEADAYRRLGALGYSQKVIAARVGRSQAHISKRLSLLTLPEAARAKMEAGELSLSDGLELVEYADRPEVVAAVVKELEAPNRGYRASAGVVAKQAAEELARKARREASIGKLAAEKTAIVKTDPYGVPAGHPTELGEGWGRLTMAPAAHAKHPCHAAYVDHDGRIRYVCTKPASHLKDAGAAGKSARELLREGRASKSSDEAKAKAALTRERNKKLRDRAPARLEKMAALLTNARALERASDFVLRQLLQITLDNAPNTRALVAEVLRNDAGAKIPTRDGIPDFRAWVSGGKSAARIRQLAYAVALLSGETPFVTLTTRGYFDEELSANAGRYMAHLRAAGYKPDAVETAQLKPANKYRWRRPFDA